MSLISKDCFLEQAEEENRPGTSLPRFMWKKDVKAEMEVGEVCLNHATTKYEEVLWLCWSWQYVRYTLCHVLTLLFMNLAISVCWADQCVVGDLQ